MKFNLYLLTAFTLLLSIPLVNAQKKGKRGKARVSFKTSYSFDEISERFNKIGTIDIRVDYLRPGLGEYFIATGSTLRTGNKVSVTRMELHNDKGILIAVGTGTYVVG